MVQTHPDSIIYKFTKLTSDFKVQMETKAIYRIFLGSGLTEFGTHIELEITQSVPTLCTGKATGTGNPQPHSFTIIFSGLGEEYLYGCEEVLKNFELLHMIAKHYAFIDPENISEDGVRMELGSLLDTRTEAELYKLYSNSPSDSLKPLESEEFEAPEADDPEAAPQTDVEEDDWRIGSWLDYNDFKQMEEEEAAKRSKQPKEGGSLS